MGARSMMTATTATFHTTSFEGDSFSIGKEVGISPSWPSSPSLPGRDGVRPMDR